MSMIRKQLYIPKDLDRHIDSIAKRGHTSEAEVIRELLRRGIATQRRQGNAGAALLGLAKLGERFGAKAPPDLSSRIDDYLYGDDA
jgi:hypothetical protein